MQKFSSLATLILIVVFACQDNQKKDDAGDIAAIKALSATRAKAFNDGNADVIAKAFTENGLLMAPGMSTLNGRQSVQQYYQKIFDQYITFLESGYEDVKVSGDLGYGIGYAKVNLVQRSGGDTLVSTAKYVNILQRQADGSWLTTHDIWNGNEE